MSAAAAYSNAGALMSSIGTKVESMAKNSDNTNNDSTTDTSGSKVSVNSCNPVSTSGEKFVGVKNLHHSHSYGRTVPLPLPTQRHSPPARATKSTPVALATTLKRNVPSDYKSNNTPNNQNEAQQRSQHQQRNLSIPIMSNQQSAAKPHNSSLSPTPPRSSASFSSAPAVAKAPAPSPSLLDATKKRSQFGFGGNHTVPCTVNQPLPRQPLFHSIQKITKSSKGTTATKTTKTTTPVTKKNKPATAPIPMQTHVNLSTTNVGASYERKKQRAKDARVKLNESIERLSVAINLAGTQSKQRAKAHAYWTNNEAQLSSTTETCSINNIAASRNDSSSPLPAASASSPVQNGITGTVAIMEEAVKTADSAKKWERPSFVGSAATMIQHLNSQCEALMRELIELKKMQNDGVLSSAATGRMQSCSFNRNIKSEDIDIVSEASQSFDDMDKRSRMTLGNDHNDADSLLEPQLKKLKTGQGEPKIQFNDVIKRDRIIIKIGSFLDPGSILRFMCVSKSWQVQLDPAMKSDSIWSPLCLKRFGAYSVREWLNQDDENSDSTQLSHINLYRQMSASNIKPRCHLEGNLNLGGGKIDNVACGWLSVVERSNGETLRSVLTSAGGELKYISLPVVELRILIQNVGVSDTAIQVPEQIISIDASTRRRGEEMFEITSDKRMQKKVYRADGSILSSGVPSEPNRMSHTVGNLIKLHLFETTVLSVFIHAKACPTTTKFRQRANFAKILLNIRGTTVPLVIQIK